MLLDFKGTRVRVQIAKEEKYSSKHTDADLRRLEVRTTIQGEKNNEGFVELINQARTDGVTSVSEDGQVQRKWRLKNSSGSHRDNEPIFHHSIELDEIEELPISSLTLAGLTLQPYKYEETFVDNNLSIKASLKLSEAQHGAVKDLQRSGDIVTVIRHGISEDPKQMRIFIGSWSRHADEVKFELLFQEETDQPKPNPLAPVLRWLGPLTNKVADNSVAVDALTDALHKKGVLSEEELSQIQRNVADKARDVKDGFFRVDDIDEL